jgi:hypothetical protein
MQIEKQWTPEHVKEDISAEQQEDPAVLGAGGSVRPG